MESWKYWLMMSGILASIAVSSDSTAVRLGTATAGIIVLLGSWAMMHDGYVRSGMTVLMRVDREDWEG